MKFIVIWTEIQQKLDKNNFLENIEVTHHKVFKDPAPMAVMNFYKEKKMELFTNSIYLCTTHDYTENKLQ